MELKEQVVSKELSVKLKALGVEQNGFWLHFNNPDDGWVLIKNEHDPQWFIDDGVEDCYCSAFTVAELGEMIGDEWDDWRIDYHERRDGHRWTPEIWDEDYWSTQKTMMARTEADARALLLIHLIEEGVIRVDK